MTLELDKHKLEKAPCTAYYIPNFITESDEVYLIDHISKTPSPRWTQLKNRRLQNWGGVPHPKGMIAEKIPDWLNRFVSQVNKVGMFGDKLANHVLLNEYLPGQGIMPHFDGPMFHPVIATLSLGSHCVEHFYREKSGSQQDKEIVASIFLEPRSLLILKDDLYHEYLHGIEEISEDNLSGDVLNVQNRDIGVAKQRETRISLTIRHVPKTSKLKLNFGK